MTQDHNQDTPSQSQSRSVSTGLQTDSRGQVLLVTTVTIVLIMLSLGLAVNTATITERERSDGVSYQQQEATAQINTVVYALEEAVEHTNHNTGLSDNPTREDRLTATDGEIDEVDRRLSSQFAVERGQLNLTGLGVNTDGIRVWSPINGSFAVQQSGQTQQATQYTVLQNAAATRNLAVTLTGENLTTTAGSAFELTVTDSGTTSEYAIFETDSATNEVTIQNATGASCTSQNVTQDNPLTISFSDATIDGNYCEILPHTETISRVDIANADNAIGSLSLVTETTAADIEYVTNDDNRTVRSSPTNNPSQLQAHTAIYSTTISVTVTTPQADVTTTVRITPGLYPDTQTRHE